MVLPHNTHGADEAALESHTHASGKPWAALNRISEMLSEIVDLLVQFILEIMEHGRIDIVRLLQVVEQVELLILRIHRERLLREHSLMEKLQLY